MGYAFAGIDTCMTNTGIANTGTGNGREPALDNPFGDSVTDNLGEAVPNVCNTTRLDLIVATLHSFCG